MVEEPEDATVAEGHTVSIDFVGRIDGQPFEGGSAQGFDLEIGSGRFIPGFEEQIVGAKAGDDLEIQVAFPEDYGNADLAGKPAVFTVHVAAIRRRELPELDDEFAKDLGDFDTLTDLRNRVRDDMKKMKERNADQEMRRTLMDSLLERAEFDVPSGMVERQLQHQLRSAHDRFAGAIDHETLHHQLEQWKEQWREGARRQVQEALLLEAVAREHELGASPEEVEAKIAELADAQGVDPARLRKQYGGEGFERALEGQLTDEKALEFLSSQARIEETSDT
jgi:trigger factor